MMNVAVKPYHLPDIRLLDSCRDDFLIWQPDKIYLILGQSNHPELSLQSLNVLEDQVDVMKRPSGGETVILSPGTVVISAISVNKTFSRPKDYFMHYNSKIIDFLISLGVKGLSFRGISDIAIYNRKILGSSIYRTRNKLFFHAVLNVNEPTGLMERYIRHPLREPDYRQGRPHSEFVTSLQEEGYFIFPAELREKMETTLTHHLLTAEVA